MSRPTTGSACTRSCRAARRGGRGPSPGRGPGRASSRDELARDRLLVQMLDAREGDADGELLRTFGGGCCEPLALLRVLEQEAHGCRKSLDVPAVDEYPGLAVDDHVGVPAGPRRDHGPAPAHRLADDRAERLRPERGENAEEAATP